MAHSFKKKENLDKKFQPEEEAKNLQRTQKEEESQLKRKQAADSTTKSKGSATKSKDNFGGAASFTKKRGSNQMHSTKPAL